MWFFVQLCSNWQDNNWLKASRGPSAIAELLVSIRNSKNICMKRQQPKWFSDTVQSSIRWSIVCSLQSLSFNWWRSMQFASSLEKCIDHCMNDFVEEHLSEMRVQTRAKLKLHLINTDTHIIFYHRHAGHWHCRIPFCCQPAVSQLWSD